MRVRYHYEMRYPWPPGREDGDVELDVADLPPLARQEAAEVGIEAMFGTFYCWEFAGAEHWWWVLPL